MMKKTLMMVAALLVSALVFLPSPPSWAQDEEEEEDGGTIIFAKPVKAVIFDHALHREQGLDCDSCHEELFSMETGTAEGDEEFTMESLYKGRYCGACHDGETAFASKTRCAVCHIGVKGYNRLQPVGDQQGAAHH